MKAFLPALLLLITIPSFADYTTPNSSVKWTLNDLVANSSGNVTLSGGEYFVSGIITIATNDTLSITTNANVKFAVNTHFLVNGTIIINPPTGVTFTATDQAAGFNGMRLDFSTASVIRKLTLEYAVSLNIRDCSPPVDSCIFRYNNNNASTTFGNGAVSLLRCNSAFTNCQFLNNKRAAIQSGSNISNAPNISNCLFMGNNTSNANVPQINLGASGTDTTKIINNRILAASTNSGAIGFLPIGTTNALITGNVIKNNRYGITFNGGSSINSMISYNQIDSNNVQGDPNLGGSGIAFSGGSASSHQNSVVTGNIIRWNLWGITIQNYAKPNLGNLSNTDTSDDGKNWFVGNTNATTPGIHLYNNSPDPITAQGNYWGDNNSAVIEAAIFHQPDNGSLGLVDYSSFVLPLDLLSFTASASGKAAVLQWKTANEKNTDRFAIEKSIDGKNFNEIGAVAASGGAGIASYSHTDNHYNNAADVYYRLKMIDKDGRYSYSNTLLLKPGMANDATIKLFPSVLQYGQPIEAEINVSHRQRVSVKYFDANGKSLGAYDTDLPTGKTRLRLQQFPAAKGVLMVQINGETFGKTLRVVVN